MITNSNESVLTKILSLIPENIKPVNYFMDVLDLGRESAYRRLRGEKALSFDEVCKLSIELGFSIDETIENNKCHTAIFNYVGNQDLSPEDGILEFLKKYETFLKHIGKAQNTKVAMSMNHLLYPLILGYENLFKFAYYRWIHQIKEVPLNYLFSDITIPKEILESCQRINTQEHPSRHTSYILDHNIMLNMVKEIQYFFRRSLINEDEIRLLQTELLVLTDRIEKTLKRGVDENGYKTDIYLSIFNIDSNTMYITSDTYVESSFWNCYGYPIQTTNPEITARHKSWLDSLKKYATLISRSNELVQADFINQQRKYINNITNEMLL